MTFGGTNVGQTGEPTVYSSYDYGAGETFGKTVLTISESLNILSQVSTRTG